MPTRPLRICLIAATVAAACTGLHAETRHVDVVVKSGKSHKECVRLARSQRLAYDFTLDRPGHFDLTFRRGVDLMKRISAESVLAQKGEYVAVGNGDHCLAWTAGKGGDTKLVGQFAVVDAAPAN